MGAGLSCPSGFEQGLLLSCRASCPDEFKYVQEQGGNSMIEKCVHLTNNSKSFQLVSLPQIEEGKPIPQSYSQEQTRVANEGARIRGEVRTQTKGYDELDRSKTRSVEDYSRIQSEYAAYTEQQSAVKEIQSIKNSLKPFRPPTAPSSDLEKERKAITDVASRNMFFAQFALFLVVLVGLSYVTLPQDTANSVALGLLTVGIGFGFFLRR